MARRAEANFVITGDATGATRAFDSVGDSARDMAKDVGSSARRMSDDMDKGTRTLGDGIDASEGKFRGLGDTIAGTGDIMQGFKDGNIVGIAMGFADLAGGITDFVVPALTAMKGAILTGLAPALTVISAHPLIAGILAAGAIIAGLIILEKKFGLVTKAVELVQVPLDAVWGFIKDLPDKVSGIGQTLLNALTWPYRKAFELIAKGWNATVGQLSISVPDWVPGIGGNGWSMPKLPTSLPSFHQGGVVPGLPGQETMAVLQAGETVLERGAGASGPGITFIVQGSVITERDLGRIVADALRQNRLIGVT